MRDDDEALSPDRGFLPRTLQGGSWGAVEGLVGGVILALGLVAVPFVPIGFVGGGALGILVGTLVLAGSAIAWRRARESSLARALVVALAIGTALTGVGLGLARWIDQSRG